MTVSSLFRQIQQTAFDLGFDHCAAARPVISDKDQAAYAAWCQDGHVGAMAYMTKDVEKRLYPTQTFPDVKTVLTLGVSYYQGPFPEKPGPAYGRIARYAWGLDYHNVILGRLEVLMERIRGVLNETGTAFLAVDTKPLLERALAAQAGLGFIGKNTLLIAPRSPSLRFHIGSWVFLAEILLNVPMDDFESPRVSEGCGACMKCLTACPTEAFEAPYRLRADKCISYLTIENKGEIPLDMRAKMGDWLFGCDVCQEVCPFNARAYEARWPEFKAERGAGAWVSLQEIMEITDDTEFKKRFGHTPLSRPKRRGLLRNACVVAGNSGAGTLVPALEKLATGSDPLIREHAAWALARLS